MNITNLTAGVQYNISVTAVAADKQTKGLSVFFSKYTKPDKVRNLTVTEITTSSISLNWTKPLGQSSYYEVEWSNESYTLNANVTDGRMTISDLTAGVQYNINVTAVAADKQTKGQSAFTSNYTKPDTVGDLTVTEITTSSISLSWTKPLGQSSYYVVEWSNGSYTLNANVTDESMNITNLTAGVQYNISVTAVAADNQTKGQSAFSSSYTKPDKVRDLAVTEITTSSISLSWTKPLGQSSYYEVEWSNGSYTLYANVTDERINITNLTAGAQYNISVTAVAENHKTKGERFFTSSYTKPDKVRDLTVTEITTSSISLSWTEPLGQSSYYEVEWSNGSYTRNVSLAKKSKTISNLTAGVQYNISVTAVAADNQTKGLSVFASNYTNPGKILNLISSVTTTSISLNWTPPSGYVLSYKVEWFKSDSHPSTIFVVEPWALLSGLIPGSSYNITITAVARDNATLGESYSITNVTEPDIVKNLSIVFVTTTSVSLSWDKPEGNANSYIVRWNSTKGNSNQANTVPSSYNITNLTPGVLYDISVVAVAVNEGKKTFTKTFTRSENPQNITVTARGTRYLNISWSLLKGEFAYFEVKISNTELNWNKTINTSAQAAYFTDLNPGRLYHVIVTTVVGDFRSPSVDSSFATVPLPPDSLIIADWTNSSLRLKWTIPDLMKGAPNIQFLIKYNGQDTPMIEGTSKELSMLASGTLYNITITTEGPQNLPSMSIQNSSYTLPNPVQNVKVTVLNTTSARVDWMEPWGSQGYYTYLVEAYNLTNALVHSENVNSKSTIIKNLEPGSNYSVNVTTIAAPDRKSPAVQASFTTKPKAVTGLKYESGTTFINVTWDRQSDYKDSYTYLVKAFDGNVLVQNQTVKLETYNFSSLSPGTFYNIVVSVSVNQVSSEEVWISSQTIPEKVFGLTATGTTTSLNLRWSTPSGRVSSYSIKLFKGGVLNQIKEQPNSSTTQLFGGLDPGVIYQVQVVTISGPAQSSTCTVFNATLPTPPGSIAVVSKTVNSINFTWSPPINMSQNQYNFTVMNGNTIEVIRNHWFLLERLQSGSSYSISVVTVGVMQYQSTAVNATTYTKPHGVSNLTQTQVTTNSVSLKWDQLESKPYYYYNVQAFNSSHLETISSNANSTNKTVDKLESGTNYTFIVTTVTPDGTRSEPSMVSYFTRPLPVTALGALTLNTSSIYLNWTKPSQYKSYYTYFVKTIWATEIRNTTVQNETVVISGLIPGTNYSFCVTVILPDSTEGEEICTHQYTKPEKAKPISVGSDGSNSSIIVTWTKPSGNVEMFKLILNNTDSGFSVTKELNSSTTSFTFDNLIAGTLYSAQLATCSGPFCEDADYVTNATFPNPPGPIKILNQTTSSIQVEWGEAPLMSSGFVYKPRIYTKENGTLHTSLNASFTFTSLPSGTLFSISVKTQGPMNLESDSVFWIGVSTRPHMVQNLKASPEETSITVSWERPQEYKDTYRYNVSWRAETPVSSEQFKNITGETFIISKLEPGTFYIITVITETADGTQAAPVTIHTRTGVSSVTGLMCAGPNQSNPEINLSWLKPAGLSTGFVIQIDNQNHTLLSNSCSSQEKCNYTVSHLKYYTEYHVLVWTQNSDQYSPSVAIDCITGIKEPPIPSNYTRMAKTVETQYNKFSVEVSPDLLNSSSGPITYVGVLLTQSIPEGQPCDAKFLTKTHDDWKNNSSGAYLTAVLPNPTVTRSTSSLTITVGTATKWNDYVNSELAESQTYQYAIALFTSLQLKSSRVDLTNSVVSITNFYPPIQLPKNPVWIVIAIGATLGIFGLLLLILFAIIIYWKRLSVKKTPDIQIDPIRPKISAAVRTEDFEAYYKKQKADSNCGFAEEFEDLKVIGTSQAKVHALNPSNKPKNRYNNVLPYDSSRVKLSIIHGDPCDDYINANYMPGYQSKKEFIAAQGPLPGTVNDFWRMIWEKNVRTLVMLTRCNEQGRVKCEQYWASAVKSCGDIIVKTTSEIILDDWTIKDFDIKNVKTAEVRSVRHFHFTAWPDHGVPETTELLISFRHLVREHMDQYSRHSPTVVHCSAGVGRTGTFIAIDRLIFQIERENMVDIFGIVHNLRMHRPLMVQTEDQYIFLNQCALDFIRSRTGNNVDLIYQNTAALSIYENISPKKRGY
ncbi:receptor-type tyrosine-protein phosphatase eta isoform X4 [Oryzias melastigma]|uniref:receptor-type tyrosine-protein phosphatase eta isoform X4 n=1 Tax=Oryzias melastigma TaxID=30732 RepID=UPI00168D22AD|nr:receptor-type tyrosine-protein phosphatase eta isoform X4 [Oryzias melastigma]